MRGSIALALAVSLGCTCEWSSEDPDASAAADASRDAGTDAPRRDAARDAGSDARPGWERLPGFPDDCHYERAIEPAAFFAGEWLGCPDALPGCEVLTSDPRYRFRTFRGARGYHDGSRGYFVIVQGDSEASADLTIVLVASDLEVLAAWHSSWSEDRGTVCSETIGMGDGSAALLLSAVRTNVRDRTSVYRLYHAPITEIGRASTPTLELTGVVVPPTNTFDSVSTSSTTVAMRASPSAQVFIVEGSRYSVTARLGEGTAIPPFTVGHDVVYESWYQFRGDESRLVHANIDVPQMPLYHEPATILIAFRTDGRDMVWGRIVERDGGGTYTASELWTAPFTVDGASLAPRQLTGRIEGVRSNVVVGSGLAAYAWTDYVTYQVHIVAIELSDGTSVQYDLPLTPVRWYLTSGPLWVTREEIVLGAIRTNARDGDEVLLRIRLSAFTPR